MTRSMMTWPVCNSLGMSVLNQCSATILGPAEYKVNPAGHQEGHDPAEAVMAQPGVGQEDAEPDVFCSGADGGEAETQHNRECPRTEGAPFDAAAIPVGAARADVQQVFGAVVMTMNQVDHEDPDPRGDGHCQQGNEGDERTVETVGNQHEVDRAGEEDRKS